MNHRRNLSLGWCAAVVIAMASSTLTASASPSTLAFNVDRLDTLDTVSELQAFTEQYPAKFAGIYYKRQSNTLHVNLTIDQTKYRAYGQHFESISLAPVRGTATYQPRTGPRIATHHVGNSKLALKRTMAQVRTSEKWAKQAAGRTVYWGINPRVNKVEIGVTEITQKLLATAQRLFGDRVVLHVSERLHRMTKKTPVNPEETEIVQVRKSSSPTVQAVAGPPLIDYAPQAGGARMWRLADKDGDGTYDWLFQCTAGFKWHNGGGLYSLSTAGHCGPLYQPWTQGYLDEEANVLYETGPIGTPYVRSWGDGGTDSMLMDNGQWQPRIWENVTTGTWLTVGVTYTYDPVAGQLVCFSGSFTGTKCSAAIRTTDTCIKVSGIVSCHQTIINSSIRVVQHGDSGGPVFYGDPADGIGVGAAGTIAAGTESGKVATFTNRTGLRSTFAGDFALSS